MKAKKTNYNNPIVNTDQTIHGRFREIARNYGENVALDFQDKLMTYKELDQKSDQLAYYLVKQLGGQRQHVAFFIETGFVLWSAKFDEVQKSVMENILEWDKASTRGFVWVTAEELMQEGVKRKLADSSYFNSEGK